MFYNFFKTTLRTLWKNKVYSFLNIFGLAIGISCAALIFLWVEDEVGFDHNHTKKDNLYIVKMNNVVDGGVFTHSSTPGLLGPSMQAEMPGIANACRTTEGQNSVLISIGDKSVNASGIYTDPDLFNMFTIPFVEGNAKTPFSGLYSMVITEKTAKKFFGSSKAAVGKMIQVDKKQDYVISGVVKDIPENSSLQFEWLAPFQVTIQQDPHRLNWGDFGTTTYIELKAGIQPANIDKLLYDYVKVKQAAATSNAHPFLFSMNHWHLYDNFSNGKETGSGRIQYVRLFSTIAWIILFIACINFMNLATARSGKRAREVGVRKVLGAGKKKLAFRFISESLLMALFATVVAIIMVSLTLPFFNALVQKNLLLELANPRHIGFLLLITLLCGLIAGSYPSLYLSSFNPVFVLKGLKMKSGGVVTIRKSLVVLQFTASIILIVGTIVIYQQIQHVKTRNLGFDKNNLIQMPLQGEMQKNFSSIKHELINTGLVENAALADHETLSDGNNTTGMNWPGKNPGSQIVISQREVSLEFMSTMGMHLSEGRDFLPTDIIEFGNGATHIDSTMFFNVIITESMEKLLGKGSAVGKIMKRPTDVGDFNLKVCGVIKDYQYGSMYYNSSPVIFYYLPQEANLLYVRCKAGTNTELLLSKIQQVIKANNPAYPFEYKFVDDRFNEKFIGEMLISKLSRVFASLAILISCLGLFGLAAFTAEQRTKEIGIRKVLGASVTGITALLSKEFIKLVCISCVVAFPLAWWMMHNWLQDYPYRIEINMLVFVIAGAAAVLIALLTVSVQAIKAAIANPVKSLRAE